ncbi:MFS transporter [Streptomyces sp. B6B3]|uniref:MFS transporter n=1 Tax=Streptomyces sp. B6B3 TaxID=3153570 RepID=UPI00325CAAC9
MVLRNAAFRLLWFGGAVSGFGSWLLVVAVPVHVYQLTGSPAATGLALALEALPALLIGPFAGTLVDRWPLTRAMWAADLVGAAAVSLMLLADRPGEVWLVYVAVLVENVASTVFRPAARALTPAMVGTGPGLAQANALTAGAGSVLRLVAPPAGAALLAGPGFAAVLVVDVASYLVSAALIAAVARRHAPGRPPRGEADGSQGGTSQALRARGKVLSELRAGLAHLAGRPELRGPLTANAVFLTANAGLTALLVPFTAVSLDAPAHTVGYLISGLGVGFLVGSTLARVALDRLGVRRLLAVTQPATAGAFLLLVNAPGPGLAVLAAAGVGVPGSVLLIAVETHVQRVVPPPLLGRVGALFLAVDALAVVAGGLAAPALVAALGLTAALNALSALAFLAVPVTLSGWAAVRDHGAS